MTEPHAEILRSIPVGWCLLVVSQRALCSPYQDVRRVVEQDVEHVMAFVLVCSDDVGINRDVVGDQSVGNDSFLKTEVFR
jgi:hypothetical protein